MFNKDEVLDALEDVGYFIHTRTTQKGRTEARKLCEQLSNNLNELNGFEEDDEDKISVLNREVPPACNFGMIRRNDRINIEPLTQDMDKELLIDEIEGNRIG